jgi:hypothetical protein
VRASRSLQPDENQAPRPLKGWLTSLGLANPEMVPALAFLPSISPVQEMEPANVEFKHLTQVLAFGVATGIGSRIRNKKGSSIVAVVAGEARDVLCIMPVRERRLGWNDEARGVEIVSLDLDDQEAISWTARDGPILQICSSDFDGEHGQYIAVRRSESTTIFKPLCVRTSVKSSADLEPNSRIVQLQSHIRANPAVTFTSAVFASGQVSDITFNPWDESQIAIVSTRGEWRTWTIRKSTQSVGSQYHLQPLYHGPIQETASEQDSTSRGDSSSQILWVGDTNTLVVCTRHKLTLYRTSFESVRMLQSLDLGFQRWAHEILHIQRSRQNAAHFFMLTTTKIYWVSATSTAVGNGLVETTIRVDGLEILLSWKHFQSPGLVNNRLRITEFDECKYGRCDCTWRLTSLIVTHVILCSASNQMLIGYQCCIDSHGHAVLKSDACKLSAFLEDSMDKPKMGEDDLQRPFLEVQFRSLRYQNHNRTKKSGTGFKYMHAGIGFFQTFFLHADFGLSTALYAGRTRQDVNHTMLVKAPNQQGKLIQWWRKSALKVTDDDFVTGDEVQDVSQTEKDPLYPPYLMNRRTTQEQKAILERRKELEFHWLYSQLFHPKEQSVSDRIAVENRAEGSMALEALALKITERDSAHTPGIESL